MYYFIFCYRFFFFIFFLLVILHAPYVLTCPKMLINLFIYFSPSLIFSLVIPKGKYYPEVSYFRWFIVEKQERLSQRSEQEKETPVDFGTPCVCVSMPAHEGVRVQGRMGREENRRAPTLTACHVARDRCWRMEESRELKEK